MAGDEIRVDRKVFEALASETRIAIMKTLDIRHMTITEIAYQLGMAKSSVHEHLAKMLEVGIVEKEESERKWTYYRLTAKGKQILRPHEATKILLLLGASILAFAGGLTSLLTAFRQAEIPTLAAAPMVAERGLEATAAAEQAAPDNFPLAIGLILVAISILLGYYAYRRWKLFRPLRFLNYEF